ncbi:MAG TPA: serine hydrolase domain-containing protein [Kineosporiaceae bacterium]|nr:serine hydrolase domain-containing protein [Kineosporiaceae bacterium]
MTNAHSTPLATDTARHLLADLARAQRLGRVPSLVAGVVRDGDLAWSTGRGQVDGAEPDDDVQYRIGSITKPVTAVALLRLRDAGLLDLDHPLERYLPGTPFGERTLGQLLAHNAGTRAEAPGQWWERTPGVPWPELAAQLTAASEVPHAAGRRFHYSNIGYAALGEVISRIRGRSWADVVRDEVLLPLGMKRTTTRPDGRAARGWAVHPWADVLQPEPEHDAGAMAPAGQLWSTLADLARFTAFLIGDTGDVLDRDSLAEMREPAGVDSSAAEWVAYGLGLQVVRLNGVTYTGHTGSMPGFVCALWVDPDQQTGALALSNATSGLDTQVVLRALTTVREHEPHVMPAWQPLDFIDDDDLSLVGTWYWGTTGYGLRLNTDGELELLPLLGGGRGSRFRRCDDGSWIGLIGYHAGERLRPVLDEDRVVALDLGSFLFTRTPYDPAAPVPGGTHPSGWQDAR